MNFNIKSNLQSNLNNLNLLNKQRECNILCYIHWINNRLSILTFCSAILLCITGVILLVKMPVAVCTPLLWCHCIHQWHSVVRSPFLLVSPVFNHVGLLFLPWMACLSPLINYTTRGVATWVTLGDSCHP